MHFLLNFLDLEQGHNVCR